MGQYSISFIILVLFLGLLIGAAAGSLAGNLAGVPMVNDVIVRPIEVARDFYIIKRLEMEFTPASLIGLLVAALILYFKGRSRP